MQKLKELVFALCAQPGTSGDERAAAEFAAKELSKYGKSEIDKMGNVVCHMGKKGAARHVMLDAHIDQIGLIVTEIDKGGFLRVDRCGGVDRRTLPGSPVTVYGKEILHGIVCSTPPHLSDGGEDKVISIDKMAVDVGLTKEEAEALVSPGDRVSITFEQKSLLHSRVSSAALDDRCGCASIIRCAELLKGETLNCELTVLLSSREEVGSQGAQTGAYAIYPTEAIIVDVGFAEQPDVPPAKCGKLGGGPMVGYAPVLNREMGNTLVNLAKKLEMPYTYDVMGGSTGTNSDEVACAQAGVKTALLSIPLRYMHTPVEVADLMDVENTARLMAEYIKEVD